MKYRIQHSTEYRYESAVKVSQNQVMLSPHPSNLVNCHEHKIVVQPTVTLDRKRSDFFGNRIYSFAIEEHHRRLQVVATSVVSVTGQHRGDKPVQDSTASTNWETVATGVIQQTDPHWLDCSIYRFDSARCVRRFDYADYAKISFTSGRPILEAALDLTKRINNDFAYDPVATDVTTEVATVFELRKGVCQDFAHFQVSALRSLGLSARYVSGYLRTLPPPGKPRLIGADQSHAWISIYCGPNLGWIDMDPTNACLCGIDHIPIAWGRDYGDVVPFRGVFLGGGNHELRVSVDVCPIE